MILCSERAEQCPTSVKQDACSEGGNVEPGGGGANGALLKEDLTDDADPDIIPNLYGELRTFSHSVLVCEYHVSKSSVLFRHRLNKI